MIEKLYTVEEVAELASVTGRTIRNYLKSGRLKGRKIGGQWRFPETEVQRLLTGAWPEPGEEETAYTINEPVPQQHPAYSPHEETPAPEETYLSYDSGYDEPNAFSAAAEPPPSPEPELPMEPYPQPEAAADFSPSAGRGIYAQPAPLPGAGPPPNQNAGVPLQTGQRLGSSDGYNQPLEPVQAVPGYAAYDPPAGWPAAQRPAAQFSGPAPVYGQPMYPLMAPGGENAQAAGYPVYSVAQPVMPGTPLYAPMPQGVIGMPQPIYPPTQSMVSGGVPPYEPAPPPLGYPQQPSLPNTYPPSPSSGGYYSMQQQVSGAAGQAENKTDEPHETKVKTPQAEPQNTAVEEEPQAPFSDVGRKVSKFVAEVHDCARGPQMCAVVDQHQSLSAAKMLSERLAVIADEEGTAEGLLCQAFVEFDDRFFVARFTLFGSTAFLQRCLKLIG
jgi:excisionase family DNA binding protein